MSFLVFQDRQGLVIWPLRHVAMVREEFAGRVEALSADGELVFRPGPLVPGPPLVAVAPGTFVNPAHAQERHGELHLPGGWRVQGALPPGPAAQDPPEDPVLPEVGVRASQVLYLEVNRRTSIWWTDSGPLEPPELRRRGLKGRAQAALHPDLRPAGRDWFVNPLRLRFLRRRPPTGFLAGFDNGATVPLGRMGGPGLAASLGLADPDLPAPETPTQFGLRLVGLRRWPQRLADAPAEFLRREFEDDPARLLANLVGQTHDAQRLGESTADGHAQWPGSTAWSRRTPSPPTSAGNGPRPSPTRARSGGAASRAGSARPAAWTASPGRSWPTCSRWSGWPGAWRRSQAVAARYRAASSRATPQAARRRAAPRERSLQSR